MNNFIKLFKNKTILVTGGIGSIGFEIINQLWNFKPKEIRIFDNRETELFYALRQFPINKRIVTIFGDIREKESILKASKNVDIIFHAAAMKHVIMCEKNPFEAVKTNVIGTQNVIESAVQNQIKKTIMISTDKAVNPANVMGATKLLSERLISAVCSSTERGNSKFSIVRFGNVLASRGSVLEIWEKQVKENKKIQVTNPEMTRFFMNILDSVRLIFNSLTIGGDGETFIFKMPSVKIGTLAKSFLKWKKYDENYYKIIGNSPGEKMHEELINNEEEYFLLENDDMFVCLPLFYDKKMIKRYRCLGFKKAKTKYFSSNNLNNFLNIRQIISVFKSSIK